MFIRFPIAAQGTDWDQCHAALVNKERISLLPPWFIKMITPTLTRFPKKSARSNALAKRSLCALGELPDIAAARVLWNRTADTERCGGHGARTVSDLATSNFHAAGLTRSSHTAGCTRFPLSHTSCHEQYGKMGWSQVPPGALGSPSSPASGFHPGKPSLQLQPSSCPPRPVPPCPSLTHSLVLSFSLLAGDTLSRRLCITVIHLLLKYWVAFRLWHSELSGRKNVTLTTNFEVCFLNPLTVDSLLLFLGHFKLTLDKQNPHTLQILSSRY